MEPATSYIIHDHYPINWPPAYLEFWPQFHIHSYALCTVQVQPLYVGRHKRLYSFYVMLYMGRNSQSLADLRFAYSHNILSQRVLTLDCNFLVATDPLLYFKSLFTDRVIYLHSQSTACLCTLRAINKILIWVICAKPWSAVLVFAILASYKACTLGHGLKPLGVLYFALCGMISTFHLIASRSGLQPICSSLVTGVLFRNIHLKDET
jgi:hypothetical protein